MCAHTIKMCYVHYIAECLCVTEPYNVKFISQSTIIDTREYIVLVTFDTVYPELIPSWGTIIFTFKTLLN